MIESISISMSPQGRTLRFEIQVDKAGFPPRFNDWIMLTLKSPELINKTVFELPRPQFLGGLIEFSILRSEIEHFELLLDKETQELVEHMRLQYSDSVDAKKGSVEEITPQDIKIRLATVGFLRANSITQDQSRDIAKMISLANSANFSVPGAGKTTALLAVHSIEKMKAPNLRLLVVCPRNAQVSWDEEVEACLGPDNEVVRLSGGRETIEQKLHKRPAIASITYQQLLNTGDLILDYLVQNEIHLVLDESHRIKAGNQSKQGRIALELGFFASRRDILSGTPMPQGLSDMISQMDFLWPGTNPISHFESKKYNANNLAEVNNEISGLFVRTTKSELGLKDPEVFHHPLNMSAEHFHIYEKLKAKTNRSVFGADEKSVNLSQFAEQIIRLLLYCSEPIVFHARLVDNYPQLAQEFPAGFERTVSSKTQFLDSLINQFVADAGEKIVVWSSFVDVIRFLETRYSAFGALSIHGGIHTSQDESDLDSRESRIAKFKSDDDCRVLVANPAACGEGISLHKTAHRAVYFDRNFNAAHYLQSVDRIHRRGLDPRSTTNIHILRYSETIEDAVTSRLAAKVIAMQTVLDDQSISRLVYEPEDLEVFGEYPSGITTEDMNVILESLQ